MTCEDLEGLPPAALQEKLEQKSQEAEVLSTEILEARAEATSLRNLLTLCGMGESMVPPKFRAGDTIEESYNVPMRNLFRWLAERVDTSCESAFRVGGEVPIGKRTVYIGRMVQWSIPNTGGLKMSVPHELRDEVADLLVTSAGRQNPSELIIDAVAEKWTMVRADICTSGSNPVPAMFLVRKESSQVVVIGAWPPGKIPKDEDQHQQQTKLDRPPINADAHFASLLVQEPESGRILHSESESRERAVTAGDRVEIQYCDEWFTGVVIRIIGSTANVQCDVDAPGVITQVELSKVKLRL